MIFEGLLLLSVAAAPTEGVTDKGAFPHLPEGICFSIKPRHNLRKHPDCPICTLTNPLDTKLQPPQVMRRKTLTSLNLAVGKNFMGIVRRYPI